MSEAERLLDQMSSPEVSTPEVSTGQTRASMQAESSRILGMLQSSHEEVTASVDRIFASTMGSLDLAEDAILGARSINPEQDLRRRLGLLPGSVPGFDGPEQPQEEVSNVTECWPCSDCSFRSLVGSISLLTRSTVSSSKFSASSMFPSRTGRTSGGFLK